MEDLRKSKYANCVIGWNCQIPVGECTIDEGKLEPRIAESLGVYRVVRYGPDLIDVLYQQKPIAIVDGEPIYADIEDEIEDVPGAMEPLDFNALDNLLHREGGVT